MMNAECRMNADKGIHRARGLGFNLHSAFCILQSNPLIVLGLLTFFAGTIRFLYLSQPPLWYDESMVFRRTCGNYSQLLDCLRTDGFVPLHYSLVWVISRFFKLTTTVLRFFPALCGTLMVPAVYFLARQLVNRSTSLVAAAFTACSAFMLFYSRDAKMYMDAWLFVTLNAACLLWWFRSGKVIPWLCWIATGCAACGIHFSSAIPLAVSSLLLFTQRRLRWQKTILWLVGVVVILSGPVGYYEKFNRWEDRVNEDGWRDSGLQWIGAYNYGRTGPELFRYLGTTMMTGWEWPKDADLPQISPAKVAWPARGAKLLLAIFIASCLPWPSRWKYQTPGLRFPKQPDRLAHNPAPGCTSEPASELEPQWRVALWLSLWIALPLYGFYCRSMPDFSTPHDGWNWLIERYPSLAAAFHHLWFWILIGVTAAAMIGLIIRFKTFRPAAVRALGLLIVLAALIGLCEAMALVLASLSNAAIELGKPWESLWVPRYIGFIWPMLAIVAATLLMRLPTRPVRASVLIFLLAMNLGVAAYRVFGQTEPPVDVMAADAFEAESSANRTLFWAHLRPSMDKPGGANLFGEVGEYYLQLLENKPTDPVLFRTQMRDRQQENLGIRSSPWNRPVPPQADRVIIWREYGPDGKSFSADRFDPSPDWKVKSDQWFYARDCWIWQELGRYRRTVYEKTGE
jgi:hypothetical protein